MQSHMTTPKNIHNTLERLFAYPTLALARELEDRLTESSHRRVVFGGRVNQKASIEAACEKSETGGISKLIVEINAAHSRFKRILQAISTAEDRIRVKEAIVQDIVLDSGSRPRAGGHRA